MDNNFNKTNQKLISVTKKWWFYVILILLQFSIPPYASRNFNIAEWSNIIIITLRNGLLYLISECYPYFQTAAIVVIISLLIFKNKFAKIFNIYVALSYLVFIIFQNIAYTEKFGLSIVSINVIMFLLVVISWIWEIFTSQNNYSFPKLKIWKYWIVILALFAFWSPIELIDLQPNFNPKYIITNVSSLTFCMMTPIFLTIMILNYPKINIVTLRITSIIGTILGIYNVFNFFAPKGFWLGIVHIPLIVISVYGLILSLKIHSIPESKEGFRRQM
ncbi:MAG: hypothetical protein KAT54_02330 [Candidatus Marinimicrobia bacterium]|nr:hypothetical protein [Candidatus Neomarinimicrobiota bacterium]